MRGITVESISKYDPLTGHFANVGDGYTVRKKKGKLSVAEIQEALREKHLEGLWCIQFPVGEDTYDGWSLTEPVGDAVDVWSIEQDCGCPICGKLSPIKYWCPECGCKVKEEGQ